MANVTKIPKSRLECIDPVTGELDPFLYSLFKRQTRIHQTYEELMRIIEQSHTLDTNVDKYYQNVKFIRKRKYYDKNMYRCPVDGTLKPYGPCNTAWYHDYVDSPNLSSSKFKKKFRRRFRMSYESYLKHLDEVKSSNIYLGRGWTLDDIEEQTAISEETHRTFLHAYIHWGATELFQKYVTLPSTTEDIVDASATLVEMKNQKSSSPYCLTVSSSSSNIKTDATSDSSRISSPVDFMSTTTTTTTTIPMFSHTTFDSSIESYEVSVDTTRNGATVRGRTLNTLIAESISNDERKTLSYPFSIPWIRSGTQNNRKASSEVSLGYDFKRTHTSSFQHWEQSELVDAPCTKLSSGKNDGDHEILTHESTIPSPYEKFSNHDNDGLDQKDQEIVSEEFFSPNKTPKSFWDRLASLKSFKSNHGHLIVPKRYKDDRRLGAWCCEMRLSYKAIRSGTKQPRSVLTYEMFQHLNDLGFDWNHYGN